MSYELETIGSMVRWLEEAGFTKADVEIQEKLLIIKLPSNHRNRLLADASLRKRLIEQAREAGFSRVALEIS